MPNDPTVRLEPVLGKSTVERKPVAELNPAPYNPRKNLQPGDAEYEKLKRSIQEFGYVDPCIWNKRTGTLVGGHQRLKVMTQEFGVTEVDVVVVDVDLAHEKALNVALNKIEGSWDDRMLAELMADLRSDDSIDELLAGFDLRELDRMADQMMLEELGPDESEGAGEGEGGDETGEGARHNPVIQTQIVFDDDEQLTRWYAFTRYLRDRYPDGTTTASRINSYLTELGIGEADNETA